MKGERFILEIELGNDSMSSWDDIAQALQKVARHFDGLSDDWPEKYDSNSIRDAYGNRVGGWRVL